MESPRPVVRFFVALVGALALGACGKEEPGPAETPLPDPRAGTAAELYGLQVGARWTYLRTDDVLRWKEITACEDVLVFDPVTGEPGVVRAYVRENRSEFGTTSVHYLVQDEEGVKRVRRDDVDEGTLRMFATYAPAGVRLYNGPYADGLLWEFTLVTGEFSPRTWDAAGATETSAVDEVLGVEELEVMAGTFSTLAVERQWDARNPHNVQSWYAPGVGEVRERTEWPTEPLPTVQIEELVVYTPGFGSCDGTVPLFDAACDAPLLVCDHPWGGGSAGCTDPRVDFANCGACGVECQSGVCAGGRCVEPACDLACEGTALCCPSAWSWGAPGCTSPARDRWNCGECGNVCAEGLVCDRGECTCAPGTADCGLGCVDVLDDPLNCGACGEVCGGDTPRCDKGVCVSTCLSVDLAECDGECVDLEWDSNHCGQCGVACGDGTGTTSCMAGACVPCEDAGLTDCESDCADLSWSDKHCGACGVECGDGEVCVQGDCVPGDGSCDAPCDDGDKICCGGECVDPRTSDNHCGGCGTATCEGGCTEACRDGACVPVDCGGGDD